ncbi:MAG: hypothetical protein DWQ19_08955 [Crenarchaeota archaeon]|nr:MAG: hypothetical protein DWQ19_08955 [Thermoproteota archaeon]
MNEKQPPADLIQTKFYKVVFHGNKLLSCGNIPKNLKIEYKLNEWVKPKKKYSKLFVFKEPTYARCHAFLPGNEVYECEVVNPIPGNCILGFKQIDNPALFLKFWKHPEKDNKHLRTYDAPNNTHYCDAVKLIKKVYPI